MSPGGPGVGGGLDTACQHFVAGTSLQVSLCHRGILKTRCCACFGFVFCFVFLFCFFVFFFFFFSVGLSIFFFFSLSLYLSLPLAPRLRLIRTVVTEVELSWGERSNTPDDSTHLPNKELSGEMLSIFVHRRCLGNSLVFRLTEAILSISCVWILAFFFFCEFVV